MPWASGINPYRYVRPGRSADLGDTYYRSMSERNVTRWLRWLTDRGDLAGWEYEPRKFTFPRGAGYIPDWRVTLPDGTQVFWERKGLVTHRDRGKFARMRRHYPDVRLAVMLNDDYQQLTEDYAGLIPHWEGRRAQATVQMDPT